MTFIPKAWNEDIYVEQYAHKFHIWIRVRPFPVSHRPWDEYYNLNQNSKKICHLGRYLQLNLTVNFSLVQKVILFHAPTHSILDN